MCALRAEQIEAAAMLGTGATLQATADHVGVALRTVWEWQHTAKCAPEFNKAIRRAANAYTKQLLGEAIKEMGRLAKAAGQDMDKIGAARVIVDRMRAIEHKEVQADRLQVERDKLALEREKEAAKQETLSRLAEAAPNGVVILTPENLGWPAKPVDNDNARP